MNDTKDFAKSQQYMYLWNIITDNDVNKLDVACHLGQRDTKYLINFHAIALTYLIYR